MDKRKRIVILGGGMAGLAAAYELSKTPELRQRFRVTLLQRGWRLGGKCASSRAPHPAEPSAWRVQEHGLHVWFGFYVNAFRMIKDCYAQFPERGYSIESLFSERTSTPLMEKVDGTWIYWPLNFPRLGGAPGDEVMPSLREVAWRLTLLIRDQLFTLKAGLAHSDPVQDDGSQAWLTQLVSLPVLRSVEVEQTRVVLRAGFGSSSAEASEVLRERSDRFFGERVASDGPLVNEDVYAFTQMLRAASDGTSNWSRLRTRIDKVGPSAPTVFDQLRRAWLLADLAGAAIRGLAANSLAILQDGLDALDSVDLRAWLEDYDAAAEALDSAPIRALYDLCFAYVGGDTGSLKHGDFAAGTALRCMLRIGFGYPQAVCYTMNSGMGDAVIAPLYEALLKRDVEFEFFHDVRALELDGDGEVVGVKVRRQAKVIGGKTYQPLFRLSDGSSAWPDRPFADQLEDPRNGLPIDTGLDYESGNAPEWAGFPEETYDLRGDGGVPAKVILALPVGAYHDNENLTAELFNRSGSWRQMLQSQSTVCTQAAQLWMVTDTKGLGFIDHPNPPAMIAAPEPFDVWADMSKVLRSELWPQGKLPASVQYVCGPLSGTFSSQLQANEQAFKNLSEWIVEMVRSAWPMASAQQEFDWSFLVAGDTTVGSARLSDQWVTANFEGSERYVLSRAGTTSKRLRVDALPAANLYLAGDWTSNGLNAGCVEAAVLSGLQAALALQGKSFDDLPGGRVSGQ